MNNNTSAEKVGSAMKGNDVSDISEKVVTHSFAGDRHDPCTIVIFGASGDLTERKLIPSLYTLYIAGGLPDSFLIVGCSRTEMTSEHFREKMKSALASHIDVNQEQWNTFVNRLFYQSIEYHTLSTFAHLSDCLKVLEKEHVLPGNRIYYLAIPPSIYETTVHMIGTAGLAANGHEDSPWIRIVVEKPFGRDLTTARTLNQMILTYFQEHQIFRIDHYLARETVQSVLMFRFANAIFEPIWNRNFIDSIGIIAAETVGVEHRAGYYEEAGIIRDMFQNHMMQLLALTAMEPPSLFEAERVRDEKTKFFRSLRPFTVPVDRDHPIFGQYGSGNIDGTLVPSYRDEPGIRSDSLMPTFAMVKIDVDNWRWQGVPFYLTSGKRMAKKLTEIVINFREVPHSMFRSILGEHISPNRLIIGIQPDEKVSITFMTKGPGAHVYLRPVTMDFQFLQNYTGPVLDAYEKAIHDVIEGDHMFFWRQDGVELCWAYLTPILEYCETCADRKEQLRPYSSGSWGPDTAAQQIVSLHSIRQKDTGTSE